MNSSVPKSEKSTRPRSVVVLVCDRLNPAFLGPYGNTWVETAATNELAADALLVEHCLTDSLDLKTAYDSFWSQAGQPLFDQLGEPSSMTTTLLTDDHSVAAYPLAEGFDRHICLPTSEEGECRPAESVAETGWASIMLALLDEMQSPLPDESESVSSRLLWVHARGCDGNWTAPYSLRETFVGEEDPPAPDFVAAPSRCLSEDVDPDELLGWQQAYAAEVSVFDECFTPIVDCLSTEVMANTLFVLTSSRGFPLGEHSVVGDAQPVLHGESLHVPLLIRFPQGCYSAERIQSIWQPRDVCQLIRRWMIGEAIDPNEFGGERAVASADQSWALRTPSWFAMGDSGDESQTRLYTKPDDRFEANDVAGICESIVSDMRTEYSRSRDAAKAGTLRELPPLPTELRDPSN